MCDEHFNPCHVPQLQLDTVIYPYHPSRLHTEIYILVSHTNSSAHARTLRLAIASHHGPVLNEITIPSENRHARTHAHTDKAIQNKTAARSNNKSKPSYQNKTINLSKPVGLLTAASQTHSVSNLSEFSSVILAASSFSLAIHVN